MFSVLIFNIKQRVWFVEVETVFYFLMTVIRIFTHYTDMKNFNAKLNAFHKWVHKEST